MLETKAEMDWRALNGKLTREEAKTMGKNISKKTMLTRTALLVTLTKVVHNPIFLAYLTNRPYEVLTEYHYPTTDKTEPVLAGEFILRF